VKSSFYKIFPKLYISDSKQATFFLTSGAINYDFGTFLLILISPESGICIANMNYLIMIDNFLETTIVYGVKLR